jgi:ATP-dependent DNA helicase RecG
VREHVRLLREKYLEGYRVAAVHGRLKRQTRETIMDRFRRGLIHVLVATTVIEVGVDVANATVMVIEHAERFGLAQLHQLRGRVGRGNDGRRGLCVFIAEPTTDEARQRLEAIASTHDGFRIAEMDLEIRGMGDFFGTRQHGLPPLRVARIPDDLELLALARRDAEAIVEADPTLERPEHRLLRRVLVQQFGDALGLIDVG